jgi:hypothetical protein
MSLSLLEGIAVPMPLDYDGSGRRATESACEGTVMKIVTVAEHTAQFTRKARGMSLSCAMDGSC